MSLIYKNDFMMNRNYNQLYNIDLLTKYIVSRVIEQKI